MAIALAASGRRELPISGLEVLSHLRFEHLLKHSLNPLAYLDFDIPLNGAFKFLFSGQVHFSSLNPQITRHYPVQQFLASTMGAHLHRDGDAAELRARGCP